MEEKAMDADMRARNITRGIGSLTIQNLITASLGFVFIAAIAHFLPKNEFGIYGELATVIGIGAAVASIGLPYASARFVAMLKPSNEAEAWGAARSTLILSIVFTGIVTGAYLAMSPILSIYFTGSYAWTWLFLLGGLWLITSSFSNVALGVIQGLKRYILIAKMMLISKVVMIVFTVGALFLFSSPSVAVGAWAIYFVIVILWTFRVVTKYLARHSQKKYSYSTILRYALPIGVAGIIGALSSSLDLVVVGGLTSTSFTGIYYLAVSISSGLSVVLVSPLTTTFFPETASASQGEASNGLRLAIRFVMVFILPASLVLAALAPQLLTLFGGSGYGQGVLPLELISFFYVFLAIQTVAYTMLQALGHTTQVLVIGIVTAATDIGVAFLLVTPFGIVGGALSKDAVAVVGMILGLYYVRRYLKNLDDLRVYAKTIIAAIVPFAVAFSLTNFVSSRTLTLLPYALASLIVFGISLRALRVVGEEDKRFLGHLLPAFLLRFLRFL